MTEYLQKLRSARIVKKLPHIFGRRQKLPAGLEGATIIAIGTPSDQSLVEGGGLVIDFFPAGSSDATRVVLAFDSTAMWVESSFQIDH